MSPDDAINAYGTAEAHGGATAIEPARVMVLDEQEQIRLAETLDYYARQWALAGVEDYLGDRSHTTHLRERIEHGDTYTNPTDEYVRRTFRKRRLEAEIRKENARLNELDTQLVEEWAERGCGGEKHEATGASLSLSRRVYAKLDVDTSGLPSDAASSIRAQHKAEVGGVLSKLAEFAPLVRSDFNLQTLSAVFAEWIRNYDEDQRTLPEHERVPKAPADFLPDELRGLLVIDATPHVTVRA